MDLSAILSRQVSTNGYKNITKPKKEDDPCNIRIVDQAELSSRALTTYERSRQNANSFFTVGDSEISIAANKSGSYTMTIRRKSQENLEGQEDQEKQEEIQEFTITEDTKLSFDAEGNPVLATGSAATSNGVLRATGNNEVLIRVSASKVDSGEYSTHVVSLSDKAAEYTGGMGETSYHGKFVDSTLKGGNGNVDFGGVYIGGTITGGLGTSLFSGDFTSSILEGGKGFNSFGGVHTGTHVTGGEHENTYNGVFFGSAVHGGINEDKFTGMFLGNSVLNGNEGDDSFTGDFIDSTLNGGAGDDTFGASVTFTYLPPDRFEQGRLITETNFGNVQILGGEGDDVAQGVHSGSLIDLGDGNNRVKGIYVDSVVIAGNGDDTAVSEYSQNSIFDMGVGENSIRIATNLDSMVGKSGGQDTIEYGVKEDDEIWKAKIRTLDMSTWTMDMAGMGIGVVGDANSKSKSAVPFGLVQGAMSFDTREKTTGTVNQKGRRDADAREKLADTRKDLEKAEERSNDLAMRAYKDSMKSSGYFTLNSFV